MVIGICAIIFPVATNLEILKRDMIWNIVASIMLFVMILDGRIGRVDGMILLGAMVIYLYVVVKHALKNRAEGDDEAPMPIMMALLCIVLGLVAVIIGGQMVVNSASAIAAAWGMSETLIGLTIVAIGTSLPELVTSIVASRKGESGLAIGNAVGSCLFNILFILGLTSAISPIVASKELLVDTGLLILVTILMLILAKTQMKTSRKEGILCVVVYIAYSVYIILR